MSFLSEIDFFNKKANAANERLFRSSALAIFRGVILGTPVDEGRARGNWQASVHAPITKETETKDKGGHSTISKAESVTGSAKLGDVVYLANNLPYIGKLNSGSSTQAPAMFVEANVKRVRDNLNKRGKA